MKAITVQQPWAWAIIYGGKDVENRSRTIAGSYRGPVAIHAASRDASPYEPAMRTVAELAGMVVKAQHSAVIGVVDLVDVHHHTSCPTHHADAPWPLCSPWALHEGYHLVLRNPRPLPVPIPAKGRLGLWNLPADITFGDEE